MMTDTKPKRRNPIYPRWAEPFFGMSREYIARRGDGDFDRGYDNILDNFVAHWNAPARVNRFMPPTSRAHGMEWMPDTAKIAAKAQRIRAKRVAKIEQQKAGENAND